MNISCFILIIHRGGRKNIQLMIEFGEIMRLEYEIITFLEKTDLSPFSSL